MRPTADKLVVFYDNIIISRFILIYGVTSPNIRVPAPALTQSKSHAWRGIVEIFVIQGVGV